MKYYEHTELLWKYLFLKIVLDSDPFIFKFQSHIYMYTAIHKYVYIFISI